MASDRKAYGQTAVDDSRPMRGLVVERIDPLMEGRIGVIIPRLMPGADPNMASPKETSSPISKDAIKNTELHDGISSSITSKNFLWARPKMSTKGSYQVPYVGNTVSVYMEDGDPSKLYYDNAAPTLNGDAIPMDQVKASGDVWTPALKPNIHVFEEYKDGTIMYYNENEATREFEIKFSNGFMFSMADHATANQIEIITTTGHTIVLDQLNKKCYWKTAGGHMILLDDNGPAKIHVTTTGGHSVLMEDDKGIIATTTKGHTANLDDTSGNITLKAHTGGTITLGQGKIALTGS